MRAGIAVADSSAGLYATIGILLALAERDQSGVGQWVQTSLLQAQIAMLDFQAARYLVEGEVPAQAGNDHPYSTPMGVVQTSDGYVNIGVGGDGQWRALCKALERPDLAANPDYETLPGRYRHRPALMKTLGETFATRTSADWLERLESVGVPAGPINKLDEVFADPQVEHLGIAVKCRHPVRGDVHIVGQPLTLSRTPARSENMTPLQCEHTDAVLHEMGFGRDEIDRLRNSKVV